MYGWLVGWFNSTQQGLSKVSSGRHRDRMFIGDKDDLLLVRSLATRPEQQEADGQQEQQQQQQQHNAQSKVAEALRVLRSAVSPLCPAGAGAPGAPGAPGAGSNPLWAQQERVGLVKRVREVLKAVWARCASEPFGPKEVDDRK